MLKSKILLTINRFDQAPTNAAPGVDPPRCTNSRKVGDDLA
jgi:hypothetical protein